MDLFPLQLLGRQRRQAHIAHLDLTAADIAQGQAHGNTGLASHLRNDKPNPATAPLARGRQRLRAGIFPEALALLQTRPGDIRLVLASIGTSD